MTIPVIQNAVYRDENLTVSANKGRLILSFFNSVVSSVTFNGIAMTELVTINQDADAACWYLFLSDSVAAGSYAIAATGLNRHFGFEITGWDAVTPILDYDTKYSNDDTIDGVTSNALTVRKDCLIIDFLHLQSQLTHTPNGAQTTLYNPTGIYLYGLSKKVVAAGVISETMAWTWSNDEYAHIAVVINSILPGGVAGVFISDYGVM